MKSFCNNLIMLNKFSKKILIIILKLSLLLLLFGTVLLYNFKNFDQFFLARQIIETSIYLYMVGVGLSLTIDMYIKKNKD